MSHGTCITDDCTKPIYAKALCGYHYRKMRLANAPTCSMADCSRQVTALALALCESHYLAHIFSDPEKLARHRQNRRVANERYINKPGKRENHNRRTAIWRQNNPERCYEQGARWRAANWDRALEIRRAAQARRRARQAGAVVTAADYRDILRVYGMMCHICGGEIAGRSDMHFDHVVPLAKGGAHAPHNIRPAHAVCNMKKHTKLLL